MDYDGSGVYFVLDRAAGYPEGVWRLDIATGSVTEMAHVLDVLAIRHGYAWAGTVDSRDSSPPLSSGLPAFDTIYEVNLVTSIPTSWYYQLGKSTVLLGFADGDRPLLSVSGPPDFSLNDSETRIIDRPVADALQGGSVDSGELVSTGGLGIGSPQADGDRTWFAGDGGIYVYTSSTGLRRVFAGPANPQFGGTMFPAGQCR